MTRIHELIVYRNFENGQILRSVKTTGIIILHFLFIF